MYFQRMSTISYRSHNADYKMFLHSINNNRQWWEIKFSFSLTSENCYPAHFAIATPHISPCLQVRYSQIRNFYDQSANCTFEIFQVCQSQIRNFSFSTENREDETSLIKRSAPFIAEPPKIRLQVCSAEFFIYDKFKFENLKPYLQGENNLFADFRKF